MADLPGGWVRFDATGEAIGPGTTSAQIAATEVGRHAAHGETHVAHADLEGALVAEHGGLVVESKRNVEAAPPFHGCGRRLRFLDLYGCSRTIGRSGTRGWRATCQRPNGEEGRKEARSQKYSHTHGPKLSHRIRRM